MTLLERLAERVRTRRKELAMTIRELGERAGVSERFLVAVEGGQANVSVVKLDDIAKALGTSAAALIAEEALPMASAQRGASGLIALLGLRGAGKSTIGKSAAVRLGVPFVELDHLVAERAGMALEQIFEMHGAAYYRKLEREAVEDLAARTPSGVVATGGGLVTDAASYALVRRAATTIWLKAKPEDHMTRVVAQGDARPMANRSSAMAELRALLRARRPLYERAEHVVDTSKLGLERAIERVVKIASQPQRAIRRMDRENT